MTRYKRRFLQARNIAWLGLLIVSADAWADNAARIETRLDSGYDDNPAQRPSGDPEGFLRYGVAIARELTRNDDLWSLEMQGRYQDYEGGGDNHRLALALGWQRSLNAGKAALSLILDGALYRDRLIAADERDELGMTLDYRQLASASVELKGSAEIRWLDYRNLSLPWGGRPGGMIANGFGATPGQGMRPSSTRHQDLWRSISGEMGYYPHPDIVLALRAHYGRLDSSSAPEEYGQYGAGLFMAYQFAADWTLELALDGYERSYEQTGFRIQREDSAYTLSLRLQRDWEKMSFHLGLTRSENDSSIRQKSFQQTVTESGIAWNF